MPAEGEEEGKGGEKRKRGGGGGRERWKEEGGEKNQSSTKAKQSPEQQFSQANNYTNQDQSSKIDRLHKLRISYLLSP